MERRLKDDLAGLAARARDGDQAAFRAWLEATTGTVFRVALRMLGDVQGAEDVAQETFISLYRHGKRFRSEARFSTFVYRVAANAALNRRRTLGRSRTRIEKLAVRQAAGDDLPQQPRDPEDSTLGHELTQHVRDALGTLSPALRMPVVLYDIEGLSYGEIANVLGVAEGTVKSRIHRARQALREELQGLLPGAAGGTTS